MAGFIYHPITFSWRSYEYLSLIWHQYEAYRVVDWRILWVLLILDIIVFRSGGMHN